ncbi:Transcriptional activator flo8 [Monosporozyma unispora]|nr:Transcriptional activator flo8 [Kazachstania unispora]
MLTYSKDYNPSPMENPDPIDNGEKDDNIQQMHDQNQEYFLRANTTSPINEYENINKNEFQNEYESKVGKQKQVLNAYIYDFLLKSNHNNTAISFYKEADIIEDGNRPIRTVPDVQVPPTFVPKFNTKQSYLFEWWLIFWDLFNSKSNRDGSVLSQHYYQILLRQRQYEQGFRNIAVNAARQQFLAEASNEFKDESLNIFEFLSMMSQKDVDKHTSPKKFSKDSSHSSVSAHSSSTSSIRAHSAQQQAYMQTLQQQQQFQKPAPRKAAPNNQFPYPYPYPPPYQYSAPPPPNATYPSAPQMNPYIPSPGPTPISQNYPPIPMGAPPPTNMSLPNSPYPGSVPPPPSNHPYPHYYYPHYSRSYSQLSTMNPYTQQQLYEQELLKQQYPYYQRMQLQRTKSSPVVTDKRDHFNGSGSSNISRSNLVPILENQSGERSNSPSQTGLNRSKFNTTAKDSMNKNKVSKPKTKPKKTKYSRKQNQKVSTHVKTVLNKQKESEPDTPKSETITPRPTTMSQIFGNSHKMGQDGGEKSSVTSENNTRSSSVGNSNKSTGIDVKIQSVSDPVSPWERGSHHRHLNPQQQRQPSRLASLRQFSDTVSLHSDGHSISSVSSSSKSIRDLPYQNTVTTMESMNIRPSPTDTENSSNYTGSRDTFKQELSLGTTDDTFKYNENDDLLFFNNMIDNANRNTNVLKQEIPKPPHFATETKFNASEKDSNQDYPRRNILDMDSTEYFDHYST